MASRDARRGLAPAHRAVRYIESIFLVGGPWHYRSTGGALAAVAITKAGKLLRAFHFELNRITEAMTGNDNHLVVLEELDVAGLDRIFGTNNLQVTRIDQLLKDQ